jgi:hypothetical protein
MAAGGREPGNPLIKYGENMEIEAGTVLYGTESDTVTGSGLEVVDHD